MEEYMKIGGRPGLSFWDGRIHFWEPISMRTN